MVRLTNRIGGEISKSRMDKSWLMFKDRAKEEIGEADEKNT